MKTYSQEELDRAVLKAREEMRARCANEAERVVYEGYGPMLVGGPFQQAEAIRALPLEPPAEEKAP